MVGLAVACAGATAPRAAPVTPGDATMRWRALAPLQPTRAVAGLFGDALGVGDDRLWIGPLRDWDVGDGPPQVTALALAELVRERDEDAGGAPPPPSERILHPAGDRCAGFGRALAASGDACAIGAPHLGCRMRACDQGAAYLAFPAVAEGGGAATPPRWELEEIHCPRPEPASEFGAAVAFDGTTLAVSSPRADLPGAPDDPPGAVDAGVVDLFAVGAPPERAVTHLARLHAPRPQRGAHFGASVAVDGEWLAIGEPGADLATANAGMVHLARRTAQGWRIVDSLRAPAGAVGWYGASVALAGVDLLVGAPIARREHAPPGRPNARGSVVHLRLEGDSWRPVRVLTPADRSAGDAFGQSLAIAPPWALVGAPGDDAVAEDAGAAWALELATGRMEALRPSPAKPGARFGAATALARVATAGGVRRVVALLAAGQDPEHPLVPGVVARYVLDPQPSLGAQSRSASAIAIAAEASVTTAGVHPSRAARSCASGP
jgi:hypothetical protein